MVGIVVVSHSPALAAAAVELASQMLPGSGARIAVAAGTAGGATGTDATGVAEAISEVASPDGVLVLMDLGSALLSTELALELLGDVDYEIRLSAAPFVEGLVAAAVQAGVGSDLDRVAHEAANALSPKTTQLHHG
jgi:dihydroxyacetone kinase phosphotransfer subunit